MLKGLRDLFTAAALFLPAILVRADEAALSLLEAHCLSCHQAGHAKASLDLSSRATLVAGGDSGPAIVSGQPAQSLLFKHVTHALQPGMPYKKQKLSDQQIAVLENWIRNGAAYPRPLKIPLPSTQPTLWSLQPLARPSIPPPGPVALKSRTIRNEIDLFVQAKLAEKGLSPSPEADPRTLIRRLYHDLLGLPPTPQQVHGFLNDSSPDAYEKLVDQLLASPHYGERMARHWLDVAHYADTHGYDKDKRRDNAWHYRDYVIRSFNADKPFNRFIEEQIAGDVLYPNDTDALVATGFLAAGPWDFVGHVELGADSTDGKIARTLDRDDMLSSVISTFCSMTAHCARCHDHKFDPIPREDYYRLQAVFAGVTRGDRSIPDPRRTALEARRDALQKELEAKTPAELRELDGRIASLNQKPSKSSPTNGYHSAISSTLDVTKWVQLDLRREQRIDQIVLHPARPTDFPDTPGFGFPVRFKLEASLTPDFAHPTVIADHTAADFRSPGDQLYTVTRALTTRYLRITATKLWPRTNDYVFALAEVQLLSDGHNIAPGAAITAFDSIEAGRWGKRHLVDQYNSRVSLATNNDAEVVTLQQRRRDFEAALAPQAREQLASLSSQIAATDAELKSLPPPQKVYSVLPSKPVPIHVLHRGDVNSPRELVPPGALSAAVPALRGIFENTADEGPRRAALARWITHPQNPLAPRSIVNRIWQYHFGRALAPTPNDFGHKGTLPTHPELLDYLASQLMASNWQLKPLHKLILTSHTYRQASVAEPTDAGAGSASVDQDNLLLSRFPRRRLSAEEIRDALLLVSGKLNPALYGPPFPTFDFKDDHSPHYDYANFAQREEAQAFRRAIYRFMVRSVPDPLMEALDCADPNISTPVRNSTNTALQALVMLNDPFLLRQSHHLANRVKDDPDPITSAHQRILLRSPTPQEHRLLTEYAGKHGLANTCRLLFNTNEFLFLD